jgi:hypothetical protein
MNEEITAEQRASIEELVAMYDRQQQEQTAIIFGLLSKMGGEATLTQKDFEKSSEYNTVLANNNENGDVVLKISYEHRENLENLNE